MPVEDSDSLIEEIDIFLVLDDSIPPAPRPPEKPLDDDVYFDIEPDTGVLTTIVMDDISDNSTREFYVHVPNVLPTLPTFYPVDPHESSQCQPMNQNYFEPNYFGNDQSPQYHQPLIIQENPNQQKMNDFLTTMQSFCKILQQRLAADIDRPPLQEMSIQEIEDLKQHYLDEMLSLSNDLGIKDYSNEKIDIRFRRECEVMIDELKSKFNGMSIEINKKKELQYLEQVANLSTYSSQRFKSFCCYDDDDDNDEEYSIQVSEFYKNSPIAITSVLPTIKPDDSLSIGDQHLSTIPEKESNKVIKSSVENLVRIPSESKDLIDYESECDMFVCDDSLSKNKGSEDIVSIPPRKEIHHLDAIPDSIQSFLNHANSINSLIEEFAGKLAPINPIPSGIVEADFDPKKDIRPIEILLNDDSFPHSEIPDAIIESFSPFPMPVKDKGDVLFLKELLNDDSISLPEYESFHVDFYNVPSSPRPPEKPLDDDVYFDIEPDTKVLTTKVVDDIYDNSTRELYVHVPNVLPTLPTLYLVFDTLLPFLSKNVDKVFNPGILISKEEKSRHLLSHRGFKAFQLIFDFSVSPMMIYGGNIPILDVLFLYFYPS
nr:hypothetical protein [Tanacetum cinerariifolium]